MEPLVVAVLKGASAASAETRFRKPGSMRSQSTSDQLQTSALQEAERPDLDLPEAQPTTEAPIMQADLHTDRDGFEDTAPIERPVLSDLEKKQAALIAKTQVSECSADDEEPTPGVPHEESARARS